jgi:hypothetical protein
MLPRFGSIHDNPVRKSVRAPSRLSRLRHGIQLRPFGIVLVRGGNRQTADAGRQRRLPVPGLLAENGGANLKQQFVLRVLPGSLSSETGLSSADRPAKCPHELLDFLSAVRARRYFFIIILAAISEPIHWACSAG